jgi:hypothetical protein
MFSYAVRCLLPSFQIENDSLKFTMRKFQDVEGKALKAAFGDSYSPSSSTKMKSPNKSTDASANQQEENKEDNY